MNRRAICVLAWAVLTICGFELQAHGQGLIAQLPKDGAWVRFEGTVKQVELRPDAPEGDISMEWIQHLTLKSVGGEKAQFHGKQVPCRWIEIKVLVGKASEAGVDPGPVGERIYKILVPEERVMGDVADAGKIPFSYLDIVKGFRKVGATVSPIPLAGRNDGAFQVFPLVCSLMHYDVVEAAGGPEKVQFPGGSVSARKFKAHRVIESPTLRTTTDAEMWRCDGQSIPFGLAKWTTKTALDRKDDAGARTAFKPSTQVTVEMAAHEWGTGAKSELAGN